MRGVIAGLLVLAAARVGGADSQPAATTGSQTVITSKRFEYANGKREAVFEENVVVTDPRLSMKADKMWVFFDEDQQVSTIKATGQAIEVKTADRTAGGRNMVYDVKLGRLVLTDNAWVKQGGNLLKGERIELWRDEERVVSQENVTFRMTLNSTSAPPVVRPRSP